MRLGCAFAERACVESAFAECACVARERGDVFWVLGWEGFALGASVDGIRALICVICATP